jgi:hypothetical protein
MNKFEQNFTRVLKCHETEVNEGNLQVIDRLKKLEQLNRQKKQQLDFQRMVSIRSSRYL